MTTTTKARATMRTIATLLLTLLSVTAAVSQTTATTTALPLRLRVASYNIHHGEGLDRKTDFARLAATLDGLNADVIAVQEVDSMTSRTAQTYALGTMARLMAYHDIYGPAIDFQGGKYGVGILSRRRPLRVTQHELPGSRERRTLLVAEYADFVFACTHLSLDEEERMRSLPIIISTAESYDKPFIVAGDWNARPQSAFIKALTERFQVCTDTATPTFPADKPTACLDYIAVYKRQGDARRSGKADSQWAPYRPYVGEAAVVCSSTVVQETAASDHRPVAAELILPTPTDRLMTTSPYLQLATPTSVDVMFQTNSVCHCWIEYGTDTLSLRRKRTLLDGQEVCFDTDNTIRLDSLAPATRYYYRVCATELLMKRSYENHFGGDTLRTQFYSFTTPSDRGGDFTCVIFNDLHENKAAYDRLRQLISGIDYDFVVFNGDCLPEPSSRSHALSMIHSLTDPIGGACKPSIFLRGNHEIRNFYSAGMHHLIGYYGGKTYCALTWGDTRIVMLDCGEDKPDSTSVYAGLNDFDQLRRDQLAFITSELKSKAFRRAHHHVLISHIPVFGNTDSYRPCTSLWGPVLSKAPFDIAIGAHTHKAAFHPDGADGCPYPVMIGGGPSPSKATAIVLRSHNGKLTMQVLSDNKEASRTYEYR